MDFNDLVFRFGLNSGEDKRIREITESVGVFHSYEIDIAQELAVEHIIKGPDKSGYHFIVCEYKSELIGYSTYGEIPCTKNRYDLYWIVICQKFRGMNLGKKLLYQTEEIIKNRGGIKIYVETSSKDSYYGTRRFYEKCGYKIEAVFKDFYDTGDDKIVFVKNL